MANGNIEVRNGGRAAQWLRDWLPLIGMLIAGLVWGMKLEGSARNSEQDILALTKEVYELRGLMVTSGKTEERLNAVTERVRNLEAACVTRRTEQ